jgi:ribose transport system substrate-binding protein
MKKTRSSGAVVIASRRRQPWLAAASLATTASLVLVGCNADGTTSDQTPSDGTGEPTATTGIGTPISELPTERYVESDEVGEVPAGLPDRVAFANLGPAEVFTAWGDGLKSTAESLGLEFITASAEFDPATNVDQMRSFITRGIAAMFVIDQDVPSQRPVVCEAMQTGAAVFTVSFGPSTTQLMADQYATGKAAAEAMVQYINENFDGEGNVLLFNQDNKEGIRPRAQAVRDVVETADGINIVVDQLTQEETQEWGFEAMNTALQSNPEINAVIGPDDAVLGALAALEAADADQSEYVLTGINGSEQALDAVSDPDSAFRTTVAYGLAPVGVIPARYSKFWLEGRAIPQVIIFTPTVLSSAGAVEEFRADMADPVSIIGSPKQEKYFTMYGSISYETRGAYYNGTGVTPHGDDVDACALSE